MPEFGVFLEHSEVGVIALRADVSTVDGGLYRAARLVGVGAVREAALLGILKDFAEVAGYLLWLHVEGAEPLDTGRVDEEGGVMGGG